MPERHGSLLNSRTVIRTYFAPTAPRKKIQTLISRYAQIAAKKTVVQIPVLRLVIQVGELRIPNRMPHSIYICHWSCTRFMRPIHIRILSQKMIVLFWVNYKSNFRRIHGTPLFKCSHYNVRIISPYSNHHIRTRFWPLGVKSLESCGRTWLMKWRLAIIHIFAFCYLLRVIHIHCVRKTIMRLPYCQLLVPAHWLIYRLCSTYWRDICTISLMHFTEGTSF